MRVATLVQGENFGVFGLGVTDIPKPKSDALEEDCAEGVGLLL